MAAFICDCSLYDVGGNGAFGDSREDVQLFFGRKIKIECAISQTILKATPIWLIYSSYLLATEAYIMLMVRCSRREKSKKTILNIISCEHGSKHKHETINIVTTFI